ncbi:hypothetical protein L228DRAFT_13269 [Xylona heveae TC161]|uniref:Uncharacterized protein n=1 Tax=Xylona heveae (strain CBS 132557 / TC161) TaxID=1328760 RepID=A0A165JPB6_XYLHT|nr:hypothetical protein L228DRAFT_13269 [Xylona heveae TC161]KZF26477.1 hypothetical protein L228DRAFT_13269 [Xylona heveae TC161]
MWQEALLQFLLAYPPLSRQCCHFESGKEGSTPRSLVFVSLLSDVNRLDFRSGKATARFFFRVLAHHTTRLCGTCRVSSCSFPESIDNIPRPCAHYQAHTAQISSDAILDRLRSSCCMYSLSA